MILHICFYKLFIEAWNKGRSIPNMDMVTLFVCMTLFTFSWLFFAFLESLGLLGLACKLWRN